VDYVLFSRVKGVKPKINFNEKEISEVAWVEYGKINEFIR